MRNRRVSIATNADTKRRRPSCDRLDATDLHLANMKLSLDSNFELKTDLHHLHAWNVEIGTRPLGIVMHEGKNAFAPSSHASLPVDRHARIRAGPRERRKYLSVSEARGTKAGAPLIRASAASARRRWQLLSHLHRVWPAVSIRQPWSAGLASA